MGALRRVQPRHGHAQAYLYSACLLLPGSHRCCQPKHLARSAPQLACPSAPLPAQVVVLVTEDLKVICLNHNLQKEWEEDLAVRSCRRVCYCNCIASCSLHCAVHWWLGTQSVGHQRVSCRRSQTAA